MVGMKVVKCSGSQFEALLLGSCGHLLSSKYRESGSHKSSYLCGTHGFQEEIELWVTVIPDLKQTSDVLL
jgi:hypothetical protein